MVYANGMFRPLLVQLVEGSELSSVSEGMLCNTQSKQAEEAHGLQTKPK